jgi:hypothetical protein
VIYFTEWLPEGESRDVPNSVWAITYSTRRNKKVSIHIIHVACCSFCSIFYFTFKCYNLTWNCLYLSLRTIWPLVSVNRVNHWDQTFFAICPSFSEVSGGESSLTSGTCWEPASHSAAGDAEKYLSKNSELMFLVINI